MLHDACLYNSASTTSFTITKSVDRLLDKCAQICQSHNAGCAAVCCRCNTDDVQLRFGECKVCCVVGVLTSKTMGCSAKACNSSSTFVSPANTTVDPVNSSLRVAMALPSAMSGHFHPVTCVIEYKHNLCPAYKHLRLHQGMLYKQT